MKLFCRGAYTSRYPERNEVLKFDGPGVVELDEPKALFLLRDAPENFTTELPAEKAKTPEKAKPAPQVDELPEVDESDEKSFDAPTSDKALKGPKAKK